MNQNSGEQTATAIAHHAHGVVVAETGETGEQQRNQRRAGERARAAPAPVDAACAG